MVNFHVSVNKSEIACSKYQVGRIARFAILHRTLLILEYGGTAVSTVSHCTPQLILVPAADLCSLSCRSRAQVAEMAEMSPPTLADTVVETSEAHADAAPAASCAGALPAVDLPAPALKPYIPPVAPWAKQKTAAATTPQASFVELQEW